MTKYKLIFAVFAATFLPMIIACSKHSNKGPIPALFNTREEAENAAKNFNCEGAHKMGDKWMPCEKHKDHGDGHHHNH
tara:strand:+ start:299 stop:532 length:234 start_codon:yes stop_codon:yes gene_type:complete